MLINVRRCIRLFAWTLSISARFIVDARRHVRYHRLLSDVDRWYLCEVDLLWNLEQRSKTIIKIPGTGSQAMRHPAI